MKNPLLLLILSLLTAAVLTSCQDLETPAENMGDVRFTLSAFDFQNTGRPGARVEATSTWKHIYAEDAVLNITNKSNGQQYTLQYNPNDFSEAFSITLPFGNYDFESTVEGDVFESFLPYTLEGEFTLNSQSLDITLSATTDYGLVTVKNQFITEASISASGVDAESLTLLEDESYHYVYVEGGTLANLQITESYQGTLIERSITVAAYMHYNFVLQIGQGSANIIDLVMDAFGYEEEEIFIEISGLPIYLPKNGLVAWYPFNGNANDESGNKYDGTVSGAILTTDRFNIENRSYAFDGINDKITIPPFSNGTFNDQFSIQFWINNEFNNEFQTFFLRQGPSGVSKTWILKHPNTNEIRVYNENSFYSAFSSNDIVEEKWFHLLVTINKSLACVYVNGNRVDCLDTNWDFKYSEDLNFLGNSEGTGNQSYPFKGIMDDVAIWNRTLTEEEINRLFEEGSK